MMEIIIGGLVGGLILAFISVLAFVAYKHPDSYEKVYIPLLLVPVFAIFYLFGRADGFYKGFSHASSGFHELNDMVKSPRMEYPTFWPILACMVAVVYILALAFLPSIGVRGDKKSNSTASVAGDDDV